MSYFNERKLFTPYELFIKAVDDYWKNELDDSNEITDKHAKIFHNLITNGTPEALREYLFHGRPEGYGVALDIIIEWCHLEPKHISNALIRSIQHRLRDHLSEWLLGTEVA